LNRINARAVLDIEIIPVLERCLCRLTRHRFTGALRWDLNTLGRRIKNQSFDLLNHLRIEL